MSDASDLTSKSLGESHHSAARALIPLGLGLLVCLVPPLRHAGTSAISAVGDWFGHSVAHSIKTTVNNAPHPTTTG
jgi:hypothetical protein